MHKKHLVPYGQRKCATASAFAEAVWFFPRQKNRPKLFWDGIISFKAFFYQAKPVYFFKSSIEWMST